MTFSLTAIVPAHNEAAGLPATLDSLIQQTDPADEIIVVDDFSTDGTGEIARRHGVTVLRPPNNLGSKARAQNYALPRCGTDLVLAVDADTVLAPDYIEKIKPVFTDPGVTVAAGNVQTRHTRTTWERGRSIEYLFGFHWHRPIQQAAGSPVVCSGCCSMFRRSTLAGFGGFPERTIVEDMDYCVPADHEILTRGGFTTHDRLAVGDEVLALDHDNGVFEWVPVEDIAVFDYDGDLYTWTHGTAGPIAFTPRHRWPVITATGRRALVPAQELRADECYRDCEIPLTGTYNATGTLPPRLAAALGRILAAGLADAERVDWHAELWGAEPVSPAGGGASERSPGPFSPTERDEIRRHLPTPADLPALVGRLSTEAAAGMFEALGTAVSAPPGGDARSGLRVRSHADRPVRDALQMLALMVGRTSVAGPAEVHIGGVGTDNTVLPDQGVTTRHYKGKVWCPRTKHGTWVVRHGGVVVPTGNTWSQQVVGNQAVYVPDAVAWAADPETLTFLRKQVWRWMSGFFQNVRIHARRLAVHKPMLALWVALAVLEIVVAPLWLAAPVILIAGFDYPAGITMAWWLGGELALTVPPLVYAARRRRLSLRHVLGNIPFVYLTKIVNLWYAWKALVVELVLVPLRWSTGLTVYEKGRPDPAPGRGPGIAVTDARSATSGADDKPAGEPAHA